MWSGAERTCPELRFGYRSNEAGFGWTNAVFTALYDALPEALRSQLVSK